MPDSESRHATCVIRLTPATDSCEPPEGTQRNRNQVSPIPTSVLLLGCLVKILALLLAGLSVSASVAIADEASVGFLYPIGVAVAPNSEVYVADRKLPGVWKIAGGKPSVFFQASKKFRTPLNVSL